MRIAKPERTPVAAVKVDAMGIDLGLKEFLATSEAERVEAQRFYRDLDPTLPVALARLPLYTKVANRRKDFLHKLSTDLVRQDQAIFVDDVRAP